MDRVPSQPYATVIERAMQIIPARVLPLLRSPHFLCGVDPVFAGLHEYGTTTDGRSYADTAHCAYAHNQTNRYRSDRRTTVVLPTVPEPWVIVHELGHVLHETLHWEPVAEPVTAYARTDRYEAFAEAFCSSLFYNYGAELDKRTSALLDSLGR